jgi:hypothetical protein
LNEAAFTIISLSQLDTRFFCEISGTSSWNIDFVVYKRGDKEITAVSYYALLRTRSVSCELNLEAGEYIVYVSFSFFHICEIISLLFKKNEFVA